MKKTMGHYHVRGFPLETTDTGENEIFMNMFTREKGKIRVVVRGTKKPFSSLRGATLPFHENHYYIARRKTVDLLVEWEPLRYFPGPSLKPGNLSLAGYISHFILALLPFREREIYLYTLVENIYYLLQLNMNNDIIKVVFEWGFMHIAGVAPPFENCAGCGRPSKPGYFWWDIPEGNLLCPACGEGAASRSMRLGSKAVEMGSQVSALSRYLSEEPVVDNEKVKSEFKQMSDFRDESISTLGRATVRFCQYHLKEEISCWPVSI